MAKGALNQKDIIIILALCFALIGACVLFNLSLAYGFSIGIILSCIIFTKKGFRPRELLHMMARGLNECRILYILILLIGATVSIWLSSGVVPAMIYYGFDYMKDMNFLLAAFLIIAVSAVFMGTAVGTVSTIGVAVLGIGKGFGISPHILLGAIVSGAFIADKISPISGLLNLTLSSTKTHYRGALKSMLVTLLPTVALSAIIYYYLGIKYGTGSDTETILAFQKTIKEGFFISPYLLLMPVLIVLMSSSGIKVIYSILSGLLGGIAISFTLQKMTVFEILKAIVFGYRGSTSSQNLNELLISGGVVSMMEVLLIVMGAIALTAVLEGTGLISAITDKVVTGIRSRFGLILKTGLISSVLTALTCDQTMGIVLPGRLLRQKYDDMGVSRNILARTISDTGTIIAPLMPWNVNALIIGLICSGISGYEKYAVLCYLGPMLTVILAFGSKIKKR